jgi:U3 small nucleolar RNA-associated protein 14
MAEAQERRVEMEEEEDDPYMMMGTTVVTDGLEDEDDDEEEEVQEDAADDGEDSSSDDSDSEGEIGEEELASYRARVESNPQQYDAHVQLVAALRSLDGQEAALHQAR